MLLDDPRLVASVNRQRGLQCRKLPNPALSIAAPDHRVRAVGHSGMCAISTPSPAHAAVSSSATAAIPCWLPPESPSRKIHVNPCALRLVAMSRSTPV